MKKKNKIILISILIVLIILLVLIEVFRVRKKNIETSGGEYQYSKTECPSCKKGYLRSYEANNRDSHLHSDQCSATIEMCSECPYWRASNVKAHEYKDWYIDKSPTCTEKGTKKRECKNCSYYQTESIPALGHKYAEYEEIDDGHKATCSRCEYVLIEAHTLEDVNESQTCVTPEALGERCTKCSYKNFLETKLPTGHKFGIGSHIIN